jgi:hypothetical protein
MATRLYKISGDDTSSITKATITNFSKSIVITYDTLTLTDQTVVLNIDRDETSIESFILRDNKTLFITVKCVIKPDVNYQKCALKDLFVGSKSINPTPVNHPVSKSEIVFRCVTQEKHDARQGSSQNTVQNPESIMKNQHWCGTCNNH